MSEASVGRQFREDLAKEKAHIYAKPGRRVPTALEIAAEQWRAEQERAKQPTLQPQQESFVTPLSGTQANAIMPSAPSAQADWVQFNPLQPVGEQAQEPRRVSTITIFCLAKKIMAQEWRRAKGIRKRDSRVIELEKSAKDYQVRRIEREQEQRCQAMRLEKERDEILECLSSFVDLMLGSRQRKRIASLDQVGDLLTEAFGSLGEVFDVEWTEGGGCAIWLEPWPERRERRARGDVRPALRRLSLDARLNISAYERVTDPALWHEKRAVLLLRSLRVSDKEMRRLRTPERARDFLAQKAWEAGRVLAITPENGSWKIRIQPWDEVRLRKLSKSSKRPITEYEITVSKDFEMSSCKRLED